jgi:hypothetical protein
MIAEAFHVCANTSTRTAASVGTEPLNDRHHALSVSSHFANEHTALCS